MPLAGRNKLKETKEAKTEFEPKILAFCCNWCSYAGADLAGVSRFQMPTNLRVVRVMCSGRVPPELVIRALANGLDGVMILGCHPGECHYSEGNYITRRRAHVLKRLLEYTGLEPERFQLRWVSAAEGAKFAAVVKEAAEKITALGPNRLANGK
jgi:F420-non-reducing hydrogenase iron-sulfur subunit